MNEFIFNDKMVTVTLPCTKFVKNYLETEYGTPVIFPKRDQNGIYLHRILRDSRPLIARREENYDHHLTLLITEKSLYRYGFILSAECILEFNGHFTQRIKDDIITYVNAAIIYTQRLHKKVNYSNIYSSYAEDHGYNVEIFNSEFVKKTYARKEQPKYKRKNIYPLNVPKILAA